jgi:hypothetical protein
VINLTFHKRTKILLVYIFDWLLFQRSRAIVSKKSAEIFLSNLCFELADLFIYVVNEMTGVDRQSLRALKSKLGKFFSLFHSQKLNLSIADSNSSLEMNLFFVERGVKTYRSFATKKTYCCPQFQNYNNCRTIRSSEKGSIIKTNNHFSFIFWIWLIVLLF